MNPIWEKSFTERITPSNLEKDHLIAQGKEVSGVLSKIGFTLKKIFTLNRPDYNELYLAKGKEFLAKRNFEYLNAFQTTHSPEITEVVLGALKKRPPEGHLITQGEVELAEALYALETLRSPAISRDWITKEQLESIEVNQSTVDLILNIKDLDSLMKNALGQNHRLMHCINSVMEKRDIETLTNKDVAQIRGKLQAWISLRPTPDSRCFKVISKLVDDNHVALHELLRIGQNQVSRVNTDTFYSRDFQSLIKYYAKEKAIEDWDRSDFSNIERLVTLWTTHLPGENLGELNSFLFVACELNGKNFEDVLYTGLDDSILSSLEKVFEIKNLIRYPQSEINQGNAVGKALVKLIDKEDLSEISDEDLASLKLLLEIHSKNTGVSFKEFYKIFGALDKEERKDLESIIAGYPGYKKTLNLIPGETSTIESYLKVAKEIKKSGGWKQVDEHFTRCERYPIPPQFSDRYNELLKFALTNDKQRLFILATEVIPGHPNIAACLFKKIANADPATQINATDVEAWLYSMKMLYDEVPEYLHPHLDSCLESKFREIFYDSEDIAFGTTSGYPKNQVEIREWMDTSIKLFEETTGAKRIRPAKAVKLTPENVEVLNKVEGQFLERGILNRQEIEILSNHRIGDLGIIDEALLEEYLLERENLKILELTYPPLFRRLIVEELKACDLKVIQGLKSLEENHLYSQPLAIQGLQAARRLILESTLKKSSVKIDNSLVESIMTAPPPTDPIDIEKRLLGIYNLQESYAMLITNGKNNPELVKELLSKIGGELVHQEFAGKASSTLEITEILSGVIARVEEAQRETGLSSNILFNAALSMQKPDPEDFFEGLQDIVFGKELDTLINRLDYIREALLTENGKAQFNKHLLNCYCNQACERALTKEYLKPYDKEAVEIYSKELMRLFNPSDAPVNERVQGHIYNLAKVAGPFIIKGYSPAQVFRYMRESKHFEANLRTVANGPYIDETSYVPLVNSLNERLSKVSTTKPWNNFQKKMTEQPELLLSKLIPALLKGVAPEIEDKNMNFLQSQLEEVAAIVKEMPLRGKMGLFDHLKKDKDPNFDFIMNLLFSMMTQEPGRVKEKFEIFRPQIFEALKQHVDEANNVMGKGKKDTNFPFDEMVNSFVNTVEQARMKKELLTRAGGDEDIVTLNPLENFLIHTAPHFENTDMMRIAKFAVNHMPKIFNLEGSMNRSATKFLLGFLTDWYLPESGIDAIGKKDDIKKLLDPIINIIGEASPIIRDNHQVERYVGFVRGLNEAVNASEDEFSPLEVKKLLINTLGSLLCEIEGYSEGLEKVLTEVGYIAREE